MSGRTLIIAAHALAGLAVTSAVWLGCAISVVGQTGASTTRVAPFSTLPAACAAVRTVAASRGANV